MEAQNAILTKIKNETEQQLQSQILPLLSQLVNKKIEEESEKFFEKTNILGDIFPKPIGSGIFKACGKCCRCTSTNTELVFNEDYLNKCHEIRISSENFHLRNDEYILVCSAYGYLPECYPLCISYTMDSISGTNKILIVNDNFRGIYITNYGSIIYLDKNMQSDLTITTYHTGQNMLTQEFITYYNNYIDYSASGLRTDNYGSKRLTHNDLEKIIDTYKKYNPKASELYRIEKQKEEIKKMTLDLQKRETELVKNEKNLHETCLDFKEEKRQFEEEKKIHKQKSKDLLKRENSVFLKESIKSIHQELSDISYSLSDVIDLLEDVDPLIEQRLTQTIQKLTLIFNNGNENVIHATPL